MYIKASACVCVISITKKNNKKNIFLYLKFAFQISKNVCKTCNYKSLTNGDVDSTTVSSFHVSVVGLFISCRHTCSFPRVQQSYFLNYIPILELLPSDSIVEIKKPDEYVMQLV